MTLAATAEFEQLVLEVEFDPTGAPGTYSTVCGLVDITPSRTANLDTVEIPDCDDESLPLSVGKSVRSIDVSVSGSGVWALSSHKNMMDWFYSSATLNTRIRNAKVTADGASGDPEIESGPAILSNLSNTRTKGQKVTAEIEITFDGTPTVTNKV